VEVIRPRRVGAEHVALEVLRRLGLDRKLAELGFNRHPLAAAIGTLVGRLVQPGSEWATHPWLQQRSGLGELLGYDFSALDVMHLYRVSDRLLAHRAALETHLYQQERDLCLFRRNRTPDPPQSGRLFQTKLESRSEATHGVDAVYALRVTSVNVGLRGHG